jgi:hypothetical protein
MNQTKRTNRTDAEWEALVREFNASGLTQVAFCKQHGVSVHSFRRRYQRSEQFTGKRRPRQRAAFTELRVSHPTAAPVTVVRVGEHVRIECPAQMDVASIARLVRSLSDDA